MLTQARLKEAVRYDPQSGLFFWRISAGNRADGSLAGDLMQNGYVFIQIDGERYLGHVLAWLYMTGEWPTKQIDHRDAHRSNNAFTNLRLATRAQQAHNARKRKDNTSGFKGVSLHKATGKWYARIMVEGKALSLGLFDCAPAAHFARILAAEKCHGEFARHR